MGLDVYIEGLLFYKAVPMKKAAVAKALGVKLEEVSAGVAALKARLNTGALRLLETDDTLQLVTAPELSHFMEGVQKDEIRGDIGKAGAETLAIILYRGPVTRAEIDSIRGVNSSYILRNLLIRGLIERSSTKSGGGYAFSVSPPLLQHLGVTEKQHLPDYARILDQLEAFETAQQAET
ncbi:MAG: SMC-Scp complex subunit ScpB [Patescibacteria group bacterium]